MTVLAAQGTFKTWERLRFLHRRANLEHLFLELTGGEMRE